MHETLHRAILLYNQRRYDLAETELRRILTEQPEHAEALSWLGLCLIEQKKYDEAEQATKQAIGLAPDSAFAHYAQSWVLHDRNKLTEAEAAITQALQYDPYSPSYLALQSQIRISRKNWKGALEAAETGLMLDPDHVECNNLRAMALVNLGRQKEAAVSLQTTLQNDPDDAITHANLGWTFLDQGKVEKAIEHFREALRLDASSEWAQTGLIEAIKARFWPYRVLLRFFLSMNKLSDGVKVAVLLGGYFGNQFLVQIERNNPALAPWIAPITFAYLVLVLVTWFGVPLGNLALMAHPFGRMALKPREKRQALLIGLCLLGCLAGYIGLKVTKDDWYFVLGLASFFLMFPLMAWHASPEGWIRRVMLGYLLVLLSMAGIILTIWFYDPLRDLINVWQTFRWGCIISTFIVQFFPFHSAVK